MRIIKLHNRDGANLWLEEDSLVEPYISEWKLKVDSKHQYCLKYMRIIGDYEAIDPSGGPMISLGDEFNNKFKVVKIINPTTLWLSERNYNK